VAAAGRANGTADGAGAAAEVMVAGGAVAVGRVCADAALDPASTAAAAPAPRPPRVARARPAVTSVGRAGRGKRVWEGIAREK